MSESRTYKNNVSTKLVSQYSSSTSTSTSTSSTSSTTHTDPGVHIISPQDLEVIRSFYVSILGALNIYKARDIELAIDAGLETSAILDAIEQTSLAKKPSHPYLRAILQRYMRQEIFTAELAEQEREERRRERELSNRERWNNWYVSPEDVLLE